VESDRTVVVIGSGPPGAAAAWFLSRAGMDVTVMEAGSERSAGGVTLRVMGLTLANRKRRELKLRQDAIRFGDAAHTELYEELSPGGLSNHWSCAVPRFSREDFRDAERAGEAFAWPVGYDDLAPWYQQVEPLLHISGGTEDVTQVPAGHRTHPWRLRGDWNPAVARAQALGRNLIPLPYTYGAATTLTFAGNVFNAYVRLVKPLQRARRLRVKFDARALRLEWSPEKQRVTAVIYRDMTTGRDERMPCGGVVVAAGAIHSARILLESQSSDFPQGLGNTEGVLGAYLHDHPLGKLVIDLDRPVSVHPPLYISRPALDRAEPLYAAAGAQWTGTRMIAQSVLHGHPFRMSEIGFSVFGTMAPSAEDRVQLDGTRRSDGTGGLSLTCKHPPASERTLEQTRDQILEILGGSGLEAKMKVWKVEIAGNANHYGGTVRMHRSPRFGMLDGWSRMHAARNVVVADSAAFTTGPEKNPVLTSMTLAARGADRLASDLRAGTL
jgi:choline dehydrogenase-like flavoprotein